MARMVYRTISAPLLKQVAIEALMAAREEKLAGVRLGPRNVAHLLETGLVIDGPIMKVRILDRKIQKRLRAKHIPFVRREIQVIRPDVGPATLSSRVTTEERARVDQPLEIGRLEADVVEEDLVALSEIRTGKIVPVDAPIPIEVRVDPAPPTPVQVRVDLPEIRMPEVRVPAPLVIQMLMPAPTVNIELGSAVERLGEFFGGAVDRLAGAIRDQKPPIVRVTVPKAEPQITVTVPPPEIKVEVPAPHVTVEVPARHVWKEIKRDAVGRIKAVEEIPIEPAGNHP